MNKGESKTINLPAALEGNSVNEALIELNKYIFEYKFDLSFNAKNCRYELTVIRIV